MTCCLQSASAGTTSIPSIHALMAQEAAAAAEKLQDVAIAAAEGYRRITGATDIAKRSNPDCRDQDGVSEAVHKLLRQVRPTIASSF